MHVRAKQHPVTPAAGISNEADEAVNEMVQLRDEIATAMWNNHRVHPYTTLKLSFVLFSRIIFCG